MSPIFNYAIGLLMLLCTQVFAAPTEVETFDKTTWPALLSHHRQSAMIVFSSVSCTHCPGAIERLAARRAASQSATRLYVVLMDSEDDIAALSSPHHRLADRLFAFRSRAQPIQYAVNPDWRGMTPYIALVDGKGGARFVLGEPDERTLAIWLKSKK
ncbi:hypothetical protein MCEGEM3_00104 [Oxalobacteraceae bacterium]